MATPPYKGPERRREPRFAVDIPITLLRASGRIGGTCLDLSSEGMLIQVGGELDVKEGDLLRVEIAAPDEPPLIVTAVLARRIGPRMGLRVFGLSGDPERIWRALVAAVIRRHGTAPVP